MFQSRRLFVATKHKKEEVIRPVFEVNFGLRCIVPKGFDSDSLGTFSGETERIHSPLETAREKCRIVARTFNADLVIASEGSFGTHPVLGFVPFEEEILVLLDIKNNLEIKIIERSIRTNFGNQDITSVSELLDFAYKRGFPSHGIILKGDKGGKPKYFKGIVDHRVLVNCFQSLKKSSDSITAETDMRAMYNPTRMEFIRQCTLKLAEKIKHCCPECSAPGFGVERSVPGLICSLCSLPTKSVKAHIYQCQKCYYEKQFEFPHNISTEDPMYCDFCNP